MANSIVIDDKRIVVGDTVSLTYNFFEAGKQRRQVFKGILIKIQGKTPATRTVTVRKISRSGIGVEKIFPLSSPNLITIKLVKTGHARKAKLYYIRSLSNQDLTQALYRKKNESAN